MTHVADNIASQQSGPVRYGYALSLAGTLVARLATLAILVVLPAEIGLTEYGLFVLVITLGELIEMTGSNWYRHILIRQSVGGAMDCPRAIPGRNGFTLLTIIFFAGVICVFAAFLIAPLTIKLNPYDFTFAVSAYIFAFIIFRLLVSVLQAQGRQHLIGLIECIRGVLAISLVMAAVKFGYSTFLFASLGLIAATILTALIALPAVWRGLGGILLQRLAPGSFAALGVPIIIATALTYQIGWLDRFVIHHWMGPQSAGFYVAVIAIARQPIDMVLNAVNSQTFPLFMMGDSPQGADIGTHVEGVLLSIFIMGAGAAAAIAVLAEPLVRVALPAFDQQMAISLVPAIAAGSLALGLKHFVFDNIFHASGRNWLMLRWFALVSFATLGLAVALVPVYGLAGAAISFVCGSIGGLLSSIFLSRRLCHIRWPMRALLGVVLSALIAAAAAHLCTRIEAAPWVRLLTGAALFTLTYFGSLSLILKLRIATFLSAPWKADGLRGAAS